MSDLSSNLRAMDTWLVRLRNNERLAKVQIWNKYAKTVELRVDGIGRDFFTWDDVKFVEKVE